MNEMYDVVIIGAGPGGAAAAHYLAKQGSKVLLLDKVDFPRDKTCGDCLTPRALDVLDEMGVLDDIEKVGFKINGIELHGARGNVMHAAIPKHEKYPNHLVIAPRLKMDDVIRKRAVESGAEFQSPVRVREMIQEEDHVIIHADHKKNKVTYKGKVAILAVGANMRLLKNLGILKDKPKLIMAVRGYYEGIEGLTDHVQAHFRDVPLPGYGWVFPISPTAANIGIGYWDSILPWRKSPNSVRVVLDEFLKKNPVVSEMMRNAELVEPVKSYPLRVDFANAPTMDGRILLVGESAGLVSPLTGEGIDFALESGKLAAEFLGERFGAGELATEDLVGYDTVLRKHFQRLYVFLGYIRQLYINPFLMNKMILASEKFPDIKDTFVNIMMGETDAAELVNAATLRKVVLGI